MCVIGVRFDFTNKYGISLASPNIHSIIILPNNYYGDSSVALPFTGNVPKRIWCVAV